MAKPRTAAATIIIIVLITGFITNPSQALDGPALYVYPENAVYPPNATATFRVLAIDAEGNHAAGIIVLASLFDPGNNLFSSYEGETGPDGWLIFQIELGGEGVYKIVVEDTSGSLTRAEASVLVCSSCPLDGRGTTVTTTQTTTIHTSIIHTTTTTSITTITTTHVVTTTQNTAESTNPPTTILYTVHLTNTIIIKETTTVTTTRQTENTTTVTKEMTKTIPITVETSYPLFYLGLGMVIILAITSALITRQIRAMH
ncbi:MAG: hypothetical protein QXD61_12100 [Candidatus Caldarchaeum sp.]